MNEHEWSPDTCDCIVEVDIANMNYVCWTQKCFIHKGLSEQPLIDAIMTHNKSFNNAYGPINILQSDLIAAKNADQDIRLYAEQNNLATLIATLDTIDAIKQDKINEKARINDLGDPIRNE